MPLSCLIHIPVKFTHELRWETIGVFCQMGIALLGECVKIKASFICVNPNVFQQIAQKIRQI